MVKITGVDRHLNRMKRMDSVEEVVSKALYVAGQMIEADAEISITEGSISGKGHIPSKPGEPPNADTRLLDTNIRTDVISTNPPKVEVSSNAPYSAHLEVGTSKMAERPYMKPAAKRNRQKAVDLVRKAYNKHMSS